MERLIHSPPSSSSFPFSGTLESTTTRPCRLSSLPQHRPLFMPAVAGGIRLQGSGLSSSRNLIPCRPLLLPTSLSATSPTTFLICASGGEGFEPEPEQEEEEEEHGHAVDLFKIASRFRTVLLQKVVPAGAVVLLASVILLLTYPALSPPAYASIQAAPSASSVAAVGNGPRSELLSSAWTGFFAGCLHTLSGPDHLAALAPLSIGRNSFESAAVGALWGCGHDAGQMIFGLLFLLLKDQLHIEIIRTWGTRVVGITLVIIGAMGIKEASEVPSPCIALENGECVAEAIETTGGKKKIGLATFATGIVHGLQPDALLMVLPALALPSRMAGAAFLGTFLLGTVVAMGSYTVFIGSCTQALKERVPKITEKLTWAASLVAIAFGLSIIISQMLGFNLY